MSHTFSPFKYCLLHRCSMTNVPHQPGDNLDLLSIQPASQQAFSFFIVSRLLLSLNRGGIVIFSRVTYPATNQRSTTAIDSVAHVQTMWKWKMASTTFSPSIHPSIRPSVRYSHTYTVHCTLTLTHTQQQHQMTTHSGCVCSQTLAGARCLAFASSQSIPFAHQFRSVEKAFSVNSDFRSFSLRKIAREQRSPLSVRKKTHFFAYILLFCCRLFGSRFPPNFFGTTYRPQSQAHCPGGARTQFAKHIHKNERIIRGHGTGFRVWNEKLIAVRMHGGKLAHSAQLFHSVQRRMWTERGPNAAATTKRQKENKHLPVIRIRILSFPNAFLYLSRAIKNFYSQPPPVKAHEREQYKTKIVLVPLLMLLCSAERCWFKARWKDILAQLHRWCLSTYISISVVMWQNEQNSQLRFVNAKEDRRNAMQMCNGMCSAA